jgi:type IV secretory pathway VirB4 component
MREVKRAIEGKPVQNWDVANVADGVMELVETVMTKKSRYSQSLHNQKKKKYNGGN